MIAILLLVQHGAEGGEAQGFSPFDINTGLIFWTLIIFGLLLAILAKWAWPAILRSVEERERRIRAQLDQAERARADAEALLEKHRQMMVEARSEAQELLAHARSAGEKEGEQILAAARREQEGLLERARREIAAEKERAVAELRREAVDLSLAAAAKLLEQLVDSSTNRRLVEEYLDTLSEGR